MTNEEIEIKKKKFYFNAFEQTNLFQEPYFLYNRSNIIKRTFTNEINKLLSIYCSGSFYGETEKQKIDLITGKMPSHFLSRKVLKKRARPTNRKS